MRYCTARTRGRRVGFSGRERWKTALTGRTHSPSLYNDNNDHQGQIQIEEGVTVLPEQPVKCTVPAATVSVVEEPSSLPGEEKKEVKRMGVTVTMKAPDFTAPAYFKGKFTTVKLSDHLGKWVVLCFYPGDFTFV